MDKLQLLFQIGWIIIVVLLAIGFYLLFRAMSIIDIAKVNMNHLMSDLRERRAATVRRTEAARRRYGSTSENGKDMGLFTRFLSTIDNRLVWSGVAISHPWINAGFYITGMLVLSTLVFGLGLVMVNWIVGLIAAGLVIILPITYITVQTNRAYHNTEMQLKFFISLVSSNSVMASDLVNVLEMAASYMTNPVRGAILRAVNTVRVKGNPDEAVWQLEREIEHPLFKSFIRNLDICSKNDGDFRSVSKDFAVQAEQSLTQLEKERAIFSAARSEVILMVCIGLVLSFLSAKFCERDLFQVLAEMQYSSMGILILVIEIIIYLATIGYILLGKRR